MDKIWYRNPSPSEVSGRCGGDEKTNDHAKSTKPNAKTKLTKFISHDIVFLNLVFNVISMVMTYILLLLGLI